MKIKAIPTTYAGTNFRSRLEARWAAYFDELNIPWEYEPFDLEGWAPDFAITVLGEQVLVEIKPAIIESIWPGGPRILKLDDAFKKAQRHWKLHWVLLCGQRPNEDPDFFGLGKLCDAPVGAQSLWFDMSKAAAAGATEAAWRKAGNAVQWKAVFA